MNCEACHNFFDDEEEEEKTHRSS